MTLLQSVVLGVGVYSVTYALSPLVPEGDANKVGGYCILAGLCAFVVAVLAP